MKISRISVDLDTDQDTWSVRFPHDKKKSWQKMERWNVMVSSKENEQSDKDKHCKIQRFIKFRTYLDIFDTKIQFTPSHLILKSQNDIEFSPPKIRQKYLKSFIKLILKINEKSSIENN